MEVLELDNRFLIRLDKKNPRYNEQYAVVKTLTAHKWDEKYLAWAIPKKGFASEDELMEKLRIGLYQQSLRRKKNLDIPPLPELQIDIPLKKEMFHFQKQGVAYNLKHDQVLIGDQQGLGKTVQALATVVAKKQFPGLIICKSSLKLNWQKEIEEWTDLKPLIFNDSYKNTWPHLFQAGWFNVGIVNYESLQKYFVQKILPRQANEPFRLKHIAFWKWIEIFKFVIVDESHYVKDIKTKRTKFVAGLTRNKQQVYLLSGTPALNDPIELYTQLRILNQQEHFGSETVYKSLYCGKQNVGNLKQLNYLLHQHCYYRRTKQEVLTDMPEKTRQIILCELTNREEYDKAENDFRGFLQQQLADSGGQITQSMRTAAFTQMNVLKRIAARGKMQAVKEYVDSLIEQDEKVVLFAWHKEIQYGLAELHPKAVRLGDLPLDQKQRNKVAFQTDKEVPLISCSILADAEGHTLTAASNLGLVEMPWHFGKAEQCEDRLHRIGQHFPVNIAYFLADNTIDRRLYSIIMDKKEMHDSITGTDESVSEKVVDRMINLFTSK